MIASLVLRAADDIFRMDKSFPDMRAADKGVMAVPYPAAAHCSDVRASSLRQKISGSNPALSHVSRINDSKRLYMMRGRFLRSVSYMSDVSPSIWADVLAAMGSGSIYIASMCVPLNGVLTIASSISLFSSISSI